MTDLPAPAWIGVFAHPDDEWLAGWPLFQRLDIPLGVVFFVGDNRPGLATESEWWRPRLTEVLNELGIELLGCIGCAPDFFRSPRSDRAVWRTRLDALLEEARTDAFADAGLITHNPLGEYGHPDHLEVHRAVLETRDHHPLLISDLCYEGTISERQRRLFYSGSSYGPFTFDHHRWAAARRLYRESLRWTAREWPGQETARLYTL